MIFTQDMKDFVEFLEKYEAEYVLVGKNGFGDRLEEYYNRGFVNLKKERGD